MGLAWDACEQLCIRRRSRPGSLYQYEGASCERCSPKQILGRASALADLVLGRESRSPVYVLYILLLHRAGERQLP